MAEAEEYDLVEAKLVEIEKKLNTVSLGSSSLIKELRIVLYEVSSPFVLKKKVK